MIGRQQATKRYFTRSKPPKGVKQDGSREWISVKAAITAAGQALSPGIIYQSSSQLVKDGWLRDWDIEGFRAGVTSTESGWTNAELALQFLEDTIDKETRQEGGGSRLLVLDGYSTHLTLPFLEYCDRARLILALLPAHSTHLMQPLDVGCFGPLLKAYSKALEAMQLSLPLATGITKADFWRLFEQSWKAALTAKNITNAFAACGIWPFQPEKVISQIPEKPKAASKAEVTLSIQVRRLRAQAKKDQKWQDPMIQELIGCFERMAVDLEVTRHDVTQLRATIARSKKKKINSKHLQHPDLPNLGKGIFFTPGKIAKARAWEQEKAEKAEAELAAKAARKYQLAINAANKKSEAARRKVEALQNRQERALEKTIAREERAAEKAARQQLRDEARLARILPKTLTRLPQKAIRDSKKPPRAARQAQQDQEDVWEDIDEPLVMTQKGRPIRKPSRFRR